MHGQQNINTSILIYTTYSVAWTGVGDVGDAFALEGTVNVAAKGSKLNTVNERK